MPLDLKAQYQTDTKASTDYLVEAGVDVDNFREPWDGIKQYVDYLKVNSFY
jgi:hypothetical protein